jgi:hypothetical protein
MNADERILLDMCACILVNNPKPESLSVVAGALRLLANGHCAHYAVAKHVPIPDTIDTAYSQLIADAKKRGSL